MSSHGRGRGLRRNFEGGSEKPGGLKSRGEKFSSDTSRSSEEDQRVSHVKTHGDSPIPDTFATGDLIDLVDRLDIDKLDDKKTDQVWKVTRCIKHLCNTEESLRLIIGDLHQKSLKSEEFGRKSARAFGNVSQLEVAGVKLRDVVLRNIQTDFKRKEEILAQNEQTFLNCVSLLCEVFEHMRLADGTVINVLSVPILEYCDLLLTSQTHEAIQLLGRQLQIIGEEVQRCKPEKFTDFLLKVRQMVISDNLSPMSRCVLLHILELHLVRWPSLLPDKTGEWYASVLGDQVMVRRVTSMAGPPSSSYTSSTRSNGHGKVKEEGLTAEDELVLQRVLGGGGGAPISPHSPGYPYYDAGVPRPMVSPGHMQYNTPPPNMLPSPGQFSVQPPQPRYMSGEVRRQPQQQRPVDMNGVERLAVDMMSMGLPPQVSPTPAGNRGDNSRVGGGWHAMPPTVPPLSSQPGHGPRIPTAIVPPGVPPHIRPPAAVGGVSNTGQWSSGDNRPRSNPDSAGGSSGWSAMPPQAGPGGGRPGGSGRIMPGSAQSQDSNWNAPKSGPGSWSGSQRSGGGVGGGRETDVFDIGTWENPGDSSGGGSSGSGGWERQGGSGKGGGWDDSNKPWSKQDGMGSSNESQWSNNDGADNKWSSNDGSGSNKWSSNDGSSSNKWSSNDGSGSSKWSTNDGSGPNNQWSTNESKDETSFGTWENPKSRPSLKPIRNEEVRNWSSSDNNASGWGDGSTPTKSDWANNSAGSEISPGSAWKKETSVVGNWADDLQSPRDKDENPLDASLKEARRSLSNW